MNKPPKLPPPLTGFDPPGRDATLSDPREIDTQPAMPAVRPPSPAPTLDAIFTEVRAMRSETRTELSELRADIGLVSSELKVVQGRVSNLEEGRKLDDEKRRTYSGGIAAVKVVAERASSENEDQNAAISSLVTDMQVVKPKVVMLEAAMAANTRVSTRGANAAEAVASQLVEEAKGFWKRHPKIETALASAIVAALILLTGWIYSLAHQPQPTYGAPVNPPVMTP